MGVGGQWGIQRGGPHGSHDLGFFSINILAPKVGILTFRSLLLINSISSQICIYKCVESRAQ